MRREEVLSLTTYEFSIIMVLMCSTIAFLVAPGPVYQGVHTGSWYIPLLALIPGLLYTLIYQSLIKHSPYPLPRMFEYYWGKVIGIILGLFYAWYFIIWASFWVRLFLDFQLSVITPMQPISVLVAGILITALFALNRGLTVTIRALELIFSIILLFLAILVLLGLFQTDFNRLLPLFHQKPLPLIANTIYFSRFYALTGLSLVLAHFLQQRQTVGHVTRWALVFAALLLAMTIMATIGVIGNLIENDAYPIFDMVRRLRIGDFIRNMDAFFIAVWFTGIFFGIFTIWFACLYTLQQVFRLKDYRPLAPATIILLGVMAVRLGTSALEVKDLQDKVFYPLLMIFMVIIPLLTWLIGLVRGKIRIDTTSAPTKSQV